MSICENCVYDCKYKQRYECELFLQSTPVSVYNNQIKKQNRNLHKICDKNNLKYNYLMEMLKGKIQMKYKYRVIIERELYEKEEYNKYIREI